MLVQIVKFVTSTCPKPYDINLCQEKFTNSRVSGSESRKADDLGVPNVDQNNWVKTMESIALHIKLLRLG